MCWRRMEKINWNDRVMNEVVLHFVKEETISSRTTRDFMLPPRSRR